MESIAQAATRHMLAGIEDLDELARLVERDTGKAAKPSSLKDYRGRFKKFGADWLSTERTRLRLLRDVDPEASREAGRRRYQKDPEAARAASKASRMKHPEATLRWKAKNPAKVLLNQCRGNAKQRGRECTITLENIEAMLAPMTCSATGLPLSLEREGDTSRNPWAPSIDRLDNALGYVPGNVRMVCWAFNMMRGDFPDEVVMTLAKALVERAAED